MTVTQQTYNSNSNYGERRARWTVEFNFSDITVSGSSFVFNTPTINAKFQPLTINGQNTTKPRYGYAMFATPNTTWPDGYYDPGDEPISRTSASIGGVPITSGTDHDGWLWDRPTPTDDYYRYELWFPSESNITPTYKTLDKKNYVYTGSGEQKTNAHTITLNTSDFFTSGNKSLRSLNVVFNFAKISLYATDIYSGESATGGYINDNIIDDNYTADYIHGYSHEDEGWLSPLSYNIGTVTLNVPPDINLGTPTSTPLYEGVGTYTVPIISAEAFYGGDISSITLTVGADSITQSYSTPTLSNETISITPSTAGTYTPIITIVDSRQQTKTISLSSIIVNSYVRPSVNFDVYRTNNIGKKDDEGEYGLIKATIAYTSAIANLTAPTVTILDPDNNPISKTVAWYSIYSESSGISVSSIISNWSTVSSGQEIYGLISANFDNNKSYQVTLVETDTAQGSSTPITQILSTAYYTIDFQAGGKEIAFGAPANDNLTSYPDGLFKCEMDIGGRGFLDYIYPVGSYYETSDTTFNPNTSWGGTWSKVTEGYFLQATETAANVGNTVSAGLPNITGYAFQRSTNYNTSNITWTGGGALSVSNDTTGTADGLSQVNGAVARKRVDFNASSSNSIYGNSTTVQPPAILVYIWHRTA